MCFPACLYQWELSKHRAMMTTLIMMILETMMTMMTMDMMMTVLVGAQQTQEENDQDWMKLSAWKYKYVIMVFICRAKQSEIPITCIED